MTTEFIWQLPTGSDGRHGDATFTRRGERAGSHQAFQPGVSDPRGTRFNFFDYVHQVARAADLSGFDGIQIQNDPEGDETWIVAGYVARGTRRLKLLTEFDAARGSAVYAAKNAVSFQRFTGGRFAWQVSVNHDAAQRRRFGDFTADADQLERVDEFITVARGVLTSTSYDFKGRFFEVLNGGFKGPLADKPVPHVYLSGSSDEALRLSGRQADVHLLDAAPLDDLTASIAALKKYAQESGRSVTAGLRIDVLARETEEEAVGDALRYWQQTGKRNDSKAPVTSANLWRDLATDRSGARGTLVGSYTQIIDRLAEYAAAGIGSFVLGAIPRLEEAYRIGEHVLPALRARLGNNDRKAA
ncbi:LLM class flavin-dependent oxidoreductase [Noviherbaspirillum denitrificans]|uniref:Alkanesulfonate monooxygenase n=1 Tax=Noviherbaspirillum denitrificans TaxID=1968433 RepID=A0A254TKG1_9BURK|nr:LLM class flavin-dependent oxidoreductase [Noviherbaspirillum denitrificans]OWW21802.1 alkanesulfonate monooxygenase [Noviherbaspirillum denitrificans]